MRTSRSKKLKPDRNLCPLTRQNSPTPRYDPATGQILSEVEGDSPYLTKETKEKQNKAKAAVTIAPTTGQGPDVLVHRPK